jgi:hypothetical protein
VPNLARNLECDRYVRFYLDPRAISAFTFMFQRRFSPEDAWSHDVRSHAF